MSLLNTHDVAARLHTTRRQVTILLANGDLRGSKIGRQWLIDPEDVQIYLDEKANRTRRKKRRRAA